MNKKFLMLTMTLLAVSLMVTPLIGTAQACRGKRRFVCEQVSFQIPMEGFGITSLDYAQSGNKWISRANTYGLVVGDIQGSFTANARWVYYDWVGPEEDPYMEATGLTDGRVLHTVDVSTLLGTEKTGTMKLLFVISGYELAGTWILYGGNGELRRIHGRGTMEQLPTMEMSFEGKIWYYR